jgi:U2 small nuclear ribonucleoprotein A'
MAVVLSCCSQRARASLNALRERELDLRGYKIPVIENMGVTKDQFDTVDFSDNEIRKIGA